MNSPIAINNIAASRDPAARSLFCGWGCPVGQVSRFGEAVDAPGLRPRQRLAARARGALFSGALVLSVLAWWVDLRVLLFGSAPALATAWGVLLASVAATYAHGRWWRWDFCMGYCPIGLYYTVVSPSKRFGVHFRNQERRGDGPVPLLLGFFSGPQRIEESAAGAGQAADPVRVSASGRHRG